jgi:hypothetical protein
VRSLIGGRTNRGRRISLPLKCAFTTKTEWRAATISGATSASTAPRNIGLARPVVCDWSCRPLKSATSAGSARRLTPRSEAFARRRRRSRDGTVSLAGVPQSRRPKRRSIDSSRKFIISSARDSRGSTSSGEYSIVRNPPGQVVLTGPQNVAPPFPRRKVSRSGDRLSELNSFWSFLVYFGGSYRGDLVRRLEWLGLEWTGNWQDSR